MRKESYQYFQMLLENLHLKKHVVCEQVHLTTDADMLLLLDRKIEAINEEIAHIRSKMKTPQELWDLL